MKKLLALLLACIALLSLAAVTVSYTQGSATLWRIQVDPAYDDKGNATSCAVTAMYQATFTNDADPTDTFVKQLGTCTIDCVKDAQKSVTYNGQTYTYAEIAGVLSAAASQEWQASVVTAQTLKAATAIPLK